MDLIEAALYGLVQGLTEWLPVSSTAHLRILPALMGRPDPGSGFTAVIQLGTTLALLFYFGRDILGAIGGWFRSLTGGPKDTVEARLGWGVFWGTLPIVIVGFAFKDQIRSDSVRSLYTVSTCLILMGLVMLAAERLGTKARETKDLTVRDGIVVGLWQTLSLIPGMSRSGSTMSGALFAGMDRTTAARFSFLLSVPSVLAAGLYELYDSRKELMDQGVMPILVASVVAFIVGYASIALLLRILRNQGFTWFVVYRIALALALLGLIQSGRIPAVDARGPDLMAETIASE